MEILLVLLGAVLGGAGRRLSGDAAFEQLVGRGGTTARILCIGIPIPLLLALTGAMSAGWAVMLGLGLFAGATAPMRGASMGRASGALVWRAWWRDAALVLLRGPVWGAGAAATFWLMGKDLWWAPAAAGLLQPVFYEAAYRLRLRHPTEWAEVAIGGAVGAAIILACVSHNHVIASASRVLVAVSAGAEAEGHKGG